MIRRTLGTSLLLAAAAAQAQAPASAPPPPTVPAGGSTVYRCPGPDGPHYTNALTPNEARDKGCRTIEGTPITIVPSPKPRPAASGAAAAKPSDARVDPNAQRERDKDARRILEAELRREEEKLATLRREYNNGEPERRGDERNYQTYLDRVATLKAGITRSESDIAAIKRELAKIP